MWVNKLLFLARALDIKRVQYAYSSTSSESVSQAGTLVVQVELIFIIFKIKVLLERERSRFTKHRRARRIKTLASDVTTQCNVMLLRECVWKRLH
jgi:hypothetical protein